MPRPRPAVARKAKTGLRASLRGSDPAVARFFARERAWGLRELRTLLREPGGIDPAVRRVTVKFARLPFAAITDNCEGHFFLDSARHKKISLKAIEKGIAAGKIPPNAKIYWKPAYFEILVNGSKAAEEFSGARAKEVPPMLPDSTEPVTIETARKIRAHNLRHISAVEKVADRFIAKYCRNP